MAAYIEQIWQDNTLAYPASAARFLHMEAGIGQALRKENNLSDLASVVTARGNLGLGSAALSAATAFDAAGAAAGAEANALGAIATEQTRAEAAENRLVPMLAAATSTASTNVTLTGVKSAAETDGLAVAENERVLLLAQTTGSQNGPWVVKSGAWERPPDFPAGSKVKGRAIQVLGGASPGVYLLVGSTPAQEITVGTHVQNWSHASGGAEPPITSMTFDGGTPTTNVGANPLVIDMGGPTGSFGLLLPRHGTAAEWKQTTAPGPFKPLRGEWVVEIDTMKGKVGDGTRFYNELPYAFGETGSGLITQKEAQEQFLGLDPAHPGPLVIKGAPSTIGWVPKIVSLGPPVVVEWGAPPAGGISQAYLEEHTLGLEHLATAGSPLLIKATPIPEAAIKGYALTINAAGQPEWAPQSGGLSEAQLEGKFHWLFVAKEPGTPANANVLVSHASGSAVWEDAKSLIASWGILRTVPSGAVTGSTVSLEPGQITPLATPGCLGVLPVAGGKTIPGLLVGVENASTGQQEVEGTFTPGLTTKTKIPLQPGEQLIFVTGEVGGSQTWHVFASYRGLPLTLAPSATKAPILVGRRQADVEPRFLLTNEGTLNFGPGGPAGPKFKATSNKTATITASASGEITSLKPGMELQDPSGKLGIAGLTVLEVSGTSVLMSAKASKTEATPQEVTSFNAPDTTLARGARAGVLSTGAVKATVPIGAFLANVLPGTFMGTTASGPPTKSPLVGFEYELGDWVVSRADGIKWVCTAKGNPGTWVGTSKAWTNGGEYVNEVQQATPLNVAFPATDLDTTANGLNLQSFALPTASASATPTTAIAYLVKLMVPVTVTLHELAVIVTALKEATFTAQQNFLGLLAGTAISVGGAAQTAGTLIGRTLDLSGTGLNEFGHTLTTTGVVAPKLQEVVEFNATTVGTSATLTPVSGAEVANVKKGMELHDPSGKLGIAGLTVSSANGASPITMSGNATATEATAQKVIASKVAPLTLEPTAPGAFVHAVLLANYTLGGSGEFKLAASNFGAVNHLADLNILLTAQTLRAGRVSATHTSLPASVASGEYKQKENDPLFWVGAL